MEPALPTPTAKPRAMARGLAPGPDGLPRCAWGVSTPDYVGAFWNVVFDERSSSRTGNSGGDRYIEMRSDRSCTGDEGPQM